MYNVYRLLLKEHSGEFSGGNFNCLGSFWSLQGTLFTFLRVCSLNILVWSFGKNWGCFYASRGACSAMYGRVFWAVHVPVHISAMSQPCEVLEFTSYRNNLHLWAGFLSITLTCALAALYRLKPDCNKMAKSPTSCGTSWNRMIIVVTMPHWNISEEKNVKHGIIA